MQYGTVAKMRVKPGMMDAFIKMAGEEQVLDIPGLVSTTVYQMDSNPNELIMAVVFESKEAYVKNAESPEQDARYQEFVSALEGAPEWMDGTVVFNGSKE